MSIDSSYTLKCARNDADMLRGCINRFFMSDDEDEICRLKDSAYFHLDRIVSFSFERIKHDADDCDAVCEACDK